MRALDAANAAPASRLSRNRAFNIFWAGQTLSNLGDACALIALPLLVLRATGSVMQMGLVSGMAGVGMLVAGIFAGALADRMDRRRLMISCDLGRMALYAALPLVWTLAGPQRWMIYLVTGFGAALGMCFQVTYVTAVANLVPPEQVVDANGRLYSSAALASVIGPALAGVVSARFGPVAALGVDALSFAASVLTLLCLRLRRPAADRSDRAHPVAELLAGVRFLWREPTLRALTFLIAGFSFLTLGALDLFVFHLKHDLLRGDGAVGAVFSVASCGAVAGGLLAAPGRRRWGFGICYLGGAMVQGIALVAVGIAPTVALVAPAAMLFMAMDLFKGVNSMSLRQQITPDHLLGRVTAAFWTINSAPGPIGAALLTALAGRVGAPAAFATMGGVYLLVALAGLTTPARARWPVSELAHNNPSRPFLP